MESVIDIGGMTYTLATDDAYLTLMGPVFEPETVKLFRALARGTALDVGANIGCTALLLGELCQQVHAFEPSPSTHALLVANIAGRANVAIHNIGLGDRNCRSAITFSPSNRSGGFVSDKTQAGGGHTVESITLQTLDRSMRRLRIPGVDFIKIDVEGFEGNVLTGGRKTLRKHRPVVTMELNHWCLNAFRRTSVPDFFDQLLATFPIVYAVNGDTYLDLRVDDERYVAMHRHITSMRYPAIVAAFEPGQLAAFASQYHHGLVD